MIDQIEESLEFDDEKLAKAFARKAKKVEGTLEELMNDWEAFTLKADTEPSLEAFDRFFSAKDVRIVKKRKRKSVNAFSSTPRPPVPSFGKSAGLTTPVQQRKPRTFDKPPSSTRIHWNKRKNPGEVVLSTNPHLAEVKGSKYSPPVKVLQQKVENYQWLWEKFEVVSSMQLAKVRALGEKFRIQKTISGEITVSEEEEFYEVLDRVCQTESYYVGRIWNELEGIKKLTSGSVCLENVAMVDEKEVSVCVKLDISKVSDYNLFPGQVIVVRGTNPSGDEIIVSEVHTDFSHLNLRSAPASDNFLRPVDEKKAVQERDGEGLAVHVACGPFICSDTAIGFEEAAPLHAFLNQASNTHPDAIVLCGPFIDENNKHLENLSRSYDDEMIHFLDNLRAKMEQLGLGQTRAGGD